MAFDAGRGTDAKPISVKADAPVLDYYAARSRNREVFLLNFGQDVRAFEEGIGLLPRIWTRIGRERDKNGRSHAGLLLFGNLVQRHALVGFEHIACFQSYLGWLTFRAGLEALLIVGKFVDDPKNAEVWRRRQDDSTRYRQTFSGKGLISRSLAKSTQLQQVLARLNDNFVHANTDFIYQHQEFIGKGQDLALHIGFFDKSPEIHEAHLLAFLNLLDTIVEVTDELVEGLVGPPRCRPTGKTYVDFARDRAARLAGNAKAASILKDLGLWDLDRIIGKS